MLLSCGLIEWNQSQCAPAIANGSLLPKQKGLMVDPALEYVTELYIISILCTIGIAGNMLSVVMLRLDKTRQEALWLLQALAVADTLYLLVSLFRYPLKHLLLDRADYTMLQPYVFPLLKTCQSICIWMMVLVTIDRFIHVCHPLQAPNILTFRGKKILASLTFVLGLLYNLPRFFAQCILQVHYICTDRTVTRMVYTPAFHNAVYFNLYQYAMYIIVLYVVPLSVLLYLNMRLIRTIRSSNQQRRLSYQGSSHNYSEHNATRALVVIIIIFIICETPELLLRILTIVHKYVIHIPFFANKTSNYHLHFNTISGLLMVINSAVNFFIYFFLGSRFRRLMTKRVLGKRRASNNTSGLPDSYLLHNNIQMSQFRSTQR